MFFSQKSQKSSFFPKDEKSRNFSENRKKSIIFLRRKSIFEPQKSKTKYIFFEEKKTTKMSKGVCATEIQVATLQMLFFFCALVCTLLFFSFIKLQNSLTFGFPNCKFVIFFIDGPLYKQSSGTWHYLMPLNERCSAWLCYDLGNSSAFELAHLLYF